VAFDLPENTNVSEGQSVVVGVRPEHLSLKAEDGAAVPISLDLVEPLGSEALLHASIGEHSLIVKTETHGDIDHLSGVSQVYAPAKYVSIFDSETGSALTGKHR